MNSLINTLVMLISASLPVFWETLMRTSSNAAQARLFAIAETQGGFFTAKQAEQAGFDRTNHSYHVQGGNWQREGRGLFRLVHFPLPERSDLIRWSLWSRGRDDEPQGVYSHQTALSIFDLTDLMPERLHLTVPRTFRRSASIPKILSLHFGELASRDIQEKEGYRVTRPIRAIIDLCQDASIDREMLKSAIGAGLSRGLVTRAEVSENLAQLPPAIIPGSLIPTAVAA